MDGRAIRIQGDSVVVEEIAALIQASEDAQYLRTEQDDSAGIGADFALETVATVIAIASALFFDGPIVPKLYAVLRRHRGTRISIETPTCSVSVEVTGDLSEESLRKALAELAKA
jgi:hypothetical protein